MSADDALDRITQIMGCKWSVRILCCLNQGDRRPSEILRESDELASKVMHRCLNRLEQDGLIAKETYLEVPPLVEYKLTTQGKQFIGLIDSARDMSSSWKGTLRRVDL